MSNAIDDKELDEYLSGDTQYSRRYRAIEANAVTAELDALVIKNAAIDNALVENSGADNVTSIATVKEIRSAKAERKRSLGFWMRAGVPITLAASLVLAISIQMDRGVSLKAVSREDVVIHLPQSSPAVEVPIDEAEVSFAPTSETPYLNVDKAKADIESEQRKKEVPFANRVAEGSAARSAARDMPSANKLPEGQRAGTAQASSAPASPISSAAAPKLDEQTRREQPAPSLAQRPATNQMEQVIVTGQMRRGTAEDAAMPVDVVSAEDLANLSRKRNDAPVGPRSTIPLSSFEKRANSDAEIAREQREANPTSWLTFIRELRSSGNVRDADQEWQRFVKAYPNYKIEETDTARSKK